MASSLFFFSSITGPNSSVSSVPSLQHWKQILLDRYLDICPIHHDTYLPGVNLRHFGLDSFKIYWDRLLERSNFAAPLMSFAEKPVVERFLQLLINRGILEEVTDPCKLVLHPVIVIPKKRRENCGW